MEEEKTQEGLRHMAKAAQYARFGLLRWKPDYEKAANEYAQAALAFRRARRLEEAAGALLKEAEAHEKNRAPLRAARAYEQAAMYLSMSRSPAEVAHAVQEAVSLYQQSGHTDVAAWLLRRFGQLLESQTPHEVVRLYQRAADLFEGDCRFLPALDFAGRASKVLVRHERYGDAALSLAQEKHLYVEVEGFPLSHRRALAQALAHLCDLNFAAAFRSLENSCLCVPTFQSSGEYLVLVQLLQYYELRDQDGVDRVCRSPVFKQLDEEYRHMARKLKVPGVKNLRAIARPPATPCRSPCDEGDEAASAVKKEDEEPSLQFQ